MICISQLEKMRSRRSVLLRKTLVPSEVYSGRPIFVGLNRIFHGILMSDPLNVFLATAVGTEGEE